MKNEYEVRGDTTVIYLPSAHRGDDVVREALIDTGDLELVDTYPHPWRAHICEPGRNTWYAIGKWQLDGRRQFVRMHRLITQAPRELVVDHINHQSLDNRRANLRVVTQSQNMLNRRGPNSNNTSGVRGVCWHPETRQWRPRVKVNGKTQFFGLYDSIDDARLALEARLVELGVPIASAA